MLVKKLKFFDKKDKKLDAQAGIFTFDLVEFNAKIKDLLDFYEQEYSISFDIKTPRVVCKRPLEETYDSEQHRNEETTNEVNDKKLYDLQKNG